jgi:hypothetical protein
MDDEPAEEVAELVQRLACGVRRARPRIVPEVHVQMLVGERVPWQRG